MNEDVDISGWLEISKKLEEQIKEEMPEIIWDEVLSQNNRLLFQEAYELIISILKKYLDLRQEYYNIIALWILGTYFHQNFLTFPYIFLNAMKGSGKTRTLKLSMALSNGGKVNNSMTEAVLFRHNHPLAIDEFEGVGRKGIENLRELLNSGYKKGTQVERMKEIKTPEGKDHVSIIYEVFRPIMIANISGMEDILGDRCISLTLERSNNPSVTDLIEIFETEFAFKKTHIIMDYLVKSPMWCSLCSVVASVRMYADWNSYKYRTDITPNNTTTITTYNYTKQHLFQKIKEKKITSRPLELFLPLFMIAGEMSDESILDQTLDFALQYGKEKNDDEIADNKHILVYDFISQYIDDNKFHSIKKLTEDFQNMMDLHEEWINEKWMGRSLKTLGLIKLKKRWASGVNVLLDIQKAQEKMKLFRPEGEKNE